MKKMGLVVAIFFGAILLTSTVVIALPGLMQPIDDRVPLTGTPADNYPAVQRPLYCGTGEAKSNTYVTEYKIPTACTNPIGITTDYDGNIWFAQSNTGDIVKFDPVTESFTEFENPSWPDGSNSMMWGIDYAPDGSIWFTDDLFDSIWRFSTFDESYGRLGYPSEGIDALPQKIQVLGSDVIFNDFTGGNLVILTPTDTDANMFSIPPILNGSVTSDFATDEEKNIWFTSWVFQDSGVLAKFDYEKYSESSNPTMVMGDVVDLFSLPTDATAINGVEFHDGNVWLADTSSSFFFAFDPTTDQFTKFVTSDPDSSTFGNATGIVKSTASRPYWIEAADNGNLVFNEHNANRIAVFDPSKESLVEYMVPSKNPNWADCGDMTDCGLSQIFGLTVHGEKIWFTEWVENNIGVVDTSKQLPFDVSFESDSVSIDNGNSESITLMLNPLAQQDLSELSLVAVSSDDAITVTAEYAHFQSDFGTQNVSVVIQASQDSAPGQYKVLLGASTDEVSIGKFLTVIVRP